MNLKPVLTIQGDKLDVHTKARGMKQAEAKMIEAVRELKQYGLEINTYTVNTEADARDLIGKGVDTLIGNYPEMIRNVLAAGASK